jgi:hypothetical protein
VNSRVLPVCFPPLKPHAWKKAQPAALATDTSVTMLRHLQRNRPQLFSVRHAGGHGQVPLDKHWWLLQWRRFLLRTPQQGSRVGARN